MSKSYDGIYKGIVVDNDDPQYIYRIVCQVPQVLGGAHSNWCTPITSDLFIPAIGDIVYVQFLDGDPGQPLYQVRPSIVRE